MAALDLGYLLRAANTGLASARQGTRERQAMEEQQRQDEATRLFNEWAKRNQAEFQNRQLDEQSRLRQATLDNTQQYQQGQLEAKQRDADLRKYIADQVEQGRNARYSPPSQIVQDKNNEFITLDKRQIGPTGVQGRPPATAAPKPPPAPKPPTEAESKDYFYWGKVRRGQEAMEPLKDKIRPEVLSAYFSRKMFKPALNPDEQVFMRGAREFAAGVLRKESGAAVTDKELSDVFAQYIDSGFDSPEVRAAKSAARSELEDTFKKMAGRAAQFYGDTTLSPKPPETAPEDAALQRARELLKRIGPP